MVLMRIFCYDFEGKIAKLVVKIDSKSVVQKFSLSYGLQLYNQNQIFSNAGICANN